MTSPFAGRTIHLVSDLSLTEQYYLYETAKEVKAGKMVKGEKKGKQNVYLMFEEESTRTKDSFRNAAVHHEMNVNDITDAKKLFMKESVTDVIKMFTSYSTEQSVFVIRSPMEGMCRWLENVVTGTPRPSFINAGDGRHTHPTLEYVDTFTLLELKSWQRDTIHLALVGDLMNGRTAHSKVDGLRIFSNVTVDLIAPKEIQYPVEYKAKMETNGFTVNVFSSIEEYLRTADKIADIWSFSRLQMSRIGEEAQGREEELHKAVAFRKEWRSKLPKGCKFLQTLPRAMTKPLVPYEFDGDELNAWEQASGNGYWVRMALLGMLTGRYGEGFTPTSPAPLSLVPPADPVASDFIKKVRAAPKEKQTVESVLPFAYGVVVDHISRGASEAECWSVVEAAREVMGWMDKLGSQGVYTFADKGAKGVISIPDLPHESLTSDALKKLASLAPGCTVNYVKDGSVVEKIRLVTPPRVFGFPSVSCKNASCISNPRQRQPDVQSDFIRVPFYVSSALKCKLPAYEIRLKGQLASLMFDGSDKQDQPQSPTASGHYLFACRYCMWPHFHSDIFRS
eukprot:TRINITY_DN1190_c1_g2_i1.p1 TRINITY_DN1190_c1_g2~~TRINITY_DN1190_c1_g2_i1.p1  ORF type:complete len:584 (+),score=164.41 TRINITY_DN1190_c1_g2_i1:59-1753(+)